MHVSSTKIKIKDLGVPQSTFPRDQSTVVSSNETTKESVLLTNPNHFQFGNCKICEDKASGIHYGVASCEGCKGFFKRSIGKHAKYKCKGGKSKCAVTAKDRKKCKHCRWNSCINAGMSTESIKMGRIPNSIKFNHEIEITTEEDTSVVPCKPLNISTQTSMPMQERSYYDMLISFSKCINSIDSNRILLNLMRDKSYQLYIVLENTFYKPDLERGKVLVSQQHAMSTFTGHDATISEVWSGVFKNIADTLSFIFKFVSELPGFSNLSPRDLGLLIKQHFFEIHGYIIYKLWINDEFFLLLPNGIQFTKNWIRKTMGEAALNMMLEQVRRLCLLSVNDYEIALIIPYCLSRKTDIPGLENPSELIKINEYYNQALYNEFCLNKRSKEFLARLSDVIYFFPIIDSDLKSRTVSN